MVGTSGFRGWINRLVRITIDYMTAIDNDGMNLKSATTNANDNRYRLQDGILINAVQRNREHPDTFWLPAEEIRQALQIGQLAKIGLEIAHTGERFWVILTRVERGENVPRYWGRVDNDLRVFFDEPDYEIAFGPHNVLDFDLMDDRIDEV